MTVHTLTHNEPFAIGPFRRDWVVIGLLAALMMVGVVAGVGRLFAGLAATTALNDTYPWGI